MPDIIIILYPYNIMGWQPEEGDPPLPPTIHDPAHRVALSRVVSPRVPRVVSNRLLRPMQTHPQCRRGGGLSISTFVCVCVVKYAMTYKS